MQHKKLDQFKRSSLHLAADDVKFSEDAIKKLLSQPHTEIDAVDAFGLTPYLTAVYRGRLDASELLLKSGASIKKKNKGNTALHYAVLSGNPDMTLSVLKKKKLNIDAKNREKLSPLHLAIYQGYVDVTRVLLESKANPNIESKEDYPIILEAAKKGNVPIIELLIKANAKLKVWDESGYDVVSIALINNHIFAADALIAHGVKFESKAWQITRTDENGNTLLHAASKNGHLKIVDTLLEAKANINAINKIGCSALHLAASEGQLDVVKKLIANDASIEARATDHATPFLLAVKNNQTEVALFLLATGKINIDQADIYGHTALHFAAQNGNDALLEKILSKKARSNVRDRDNLMPLHKAAEKGNTAIFESLLSDAKLDTYDEKLLLQLVILNGHTELLDKILFDVANINSPDKHGLTVLHYATAGNSEGIIKKILSQYPNIEAKTSTGQTPLHYAVSLGKVKNVSILLDETKCNVDEPDALNQTPLYIAAANGHTEIAQKLLSKSANPSIKTNSTLTPFVIAVINGHLDVVDVFLKNGADINEKDSHNQTVLDIAIKQGQAKVAQLLFSKGARTSLPSSYCLAIQHNKIDVLAALLAVESKGEVNTKNATGDTSLHVAIRNDNAAALKLLLANRDINVNQKNAKNKTPLDLALQTHNWSAAELLINAKAFTNEIDWKDKKAVTQLLHHAAKEGHLDAIKYILRKGVDINLADKEGNSALHVAARYGQLEAAQFLVEHKIKYELANEKGNTAFLEAANYGQYPILEWMLKTKQINSKFQNRFGDTALHLTIEKNYLYLIELLAPTLSLISNGDDETALHAAITQGKLDAATMLLLFNTDLELEDIGHLTPLHIAAKLGYNDIVKKIMEKLSLKLITIDQVNEHGTTPFHLATQEGHLDVMQTLAEEVDINAHDSDANTSLHFAAKTGQYHVVEFLLNHWAKANVINYENQLPLHLAIKNGHLEIAELLTKAMGKELIKIAASSMKTDIFITEFLLAQGVKMEIKDVNAHDAHGETLLHAAVIHRHHDMMETLLKIGANANTWNKSLDTPLHMAARLGDEKAVQILLAYDANKMLKNIKAQTPAMVSTKSIPALVTAKEYKPTFGFGSAPIKSSLYLSTKYRKS